MYNTYTDISVKKLSELIGTIKCGKYTNNKFKIKTLRFLPKTFVLYGFNP